MRSSAARGESEAGAGFRGSVALESLAQLSPGDYVVHMDHGVGVFKGLQHVEIGGEELESMAIEYAGGEILRVPVYRLDLVERWMGESESTAPPAVHRIGGKRWKTLKRKTSEAIEMMTVELLRLYAERESATGFAFSADTVWQKEMESSFLYEDTPDQRAATKAVKHDMESTRPMDRLICGDVGYGKTEIAIRAAFKAVQDGKQVAGPSHRPRCSWSSIGTRSRNASPTIRCGLGRSAGSAHRAIRRNSWTDLQGAVSTS